MAVELTPGGANDDAGYRITSASPLGSFTDITLSCWVYFDVLPGVGNLFRVLHKKQPASPWLDDWFLSIDNNIVTVRIAAGISLNGATVLTTGAWYHLAMTFNAGTDSLKLYVNGVQDASATELNVIPNNTATEFWIGYRGVLGAEVVNGKICEVAVWAKELLASQVYMLAQRIPPARVDMTSLRGDWPLYTDLATNPDYSGNVNNVTKFTEGTATVGPANHLPMGPRFGFDLGWEGAFTAAAAVGQPTMRRWGLIPGMSPNRPVVGGIR